MIDGYLVAYLAVLTDFQIIAMHGQKGQPSVAGPALRVSGRKRSEPTDWWVEKPRQPSAGAVHAPSTQRREPSREPQQGGTGKQTDLGENVAQHVHVDAVSLPRTPSHRLVLAIVRACEVSPSSLSTVLAATCLAAICRYCDLMWVSAVRAPASHHGPV